jgi:hypothetical protein
MPFMAKMNPSARQNRPAEVMIGHGLGFGR